MSLKILLLMVALLLLPTAFAFSADGSFDGEVSLAGVLTGVSGDEAKFNEYSDAKDGVYGRLRLHYDSGDFFLKANASGMGYDTQKYRIEGGAYGLFKAYLDYTEIPHNLTYNARTFYSGAGTNNLTYSVAPTKDTSTWSKFDYAVDRKTFGGGVRLDVLKPFFFDISASKEEKTGIRPTGAPGTSPGGLAIELPEPVDYTTDILQVKGGYSKDSFFAMVSLFLSNFDNSNENLYFRNPASGVQPNTDVRTLPPDNKYYNLAFKGSVKLPLHSKFSVNLATARTKSEANLFNSYVSTGVTNTTLSDPVFNGKINTTNYSFVLTTNPLPWLNGKLYYTYYDRENKSDEITTTDGVNIFSNELFDYHKNNFGIDLGFDLPAQFTWTPATPISGRTAQGLTCLRQRTTSTPLISGGAASTLSPRRSGMSCF